MRSARCTACCSADLPAVFVVVNARHTTTRNVRRACFFGLNHDTDAACASCLFAVIEGVAFGTDGWPCCAEGSWQHRSRTASPWSAVVRAVPSGHNCSPALLDTEIVTLEGSSKPVGGALGAARLGWLASRRWQGGGCLPAHRRSVDALPTCPDTEQRAAPAAGALRHDSLSLYPLPSRKPLFAQGLTFHDLIRPHH